MATKPILYVLFIALFLGTVLKVGAQRKNYAPIWSFHQESANIHGLSVGLFSWMTDERKVRTNGVRVEIIGGGLFLLFIPDVPTLKSDSAYQAELAMPLSERINGVNISGLGSLCDCQVNGVTLGLIGHYNRSVRGVSLALAVNIHQQVRGVQAALWNYSYQTDGLQLGMLNSAERVNGLQLGAFNFTEDLNGFQIGLWNRNERRSLPFINWSFGKN
ncbi:hypothetical protein KFE98_17040 [bacterium SCSIO 12741]|nr:hypothetical protein KFE98_17040 [bacterium SCSIO 12741]